MILSLAPMLKVTTTQFRSLIRIISRDVLLFTEMISASCILNSPTYLSRIGKYDPFTVIQIGGNNPQKISKAIQKITEETRFRLFNLNVGCPSPKVTKGQFGASLMLNPQLVIDIINETHRNSNVILSVKCRIGVDNNDSFSFFYGFVKAVSENTKCRTFYVHARKCWLDGLSPKKNRNIPELNYGFVRKVKALMPWLEIHLNGGVKSLADAEGLDGIMIGRAAVKNIFVFEDLKKYGRISEGRKNKESENFDDCCNDFCGDEEPLLAGEGKPETSVVKYEEKGFYGDDDPVSVSCVIKYEKMDIRQIIKSYLLTIDQNKNLDPYDIVPLINIFRGFKGTKMFKKLLNRLINRKVAVSACHGEILSCASCILRA